MVVPQSFTCLLNTWSFPLGIQMVKGGGSRLDTRAPHPCIAHCNRALRGRTRFRAQTVGMRSCFFLPFIVIIIIPRSAVTRPTLDLNIITILPFPPTGLLHDRVPALSSILVNFLLDVITLGSTVPLKHPSFNFYFRRSVSLRSIRLRPATQEPAVTRFSWITLIFY